jgi:hypothetical protein
MGMDSAEVRMGLSLKDALHVKSAELWLQVGEPFQALLELQKITKKAWQEAWTYRVFDAAARQALATGMSPTQSTLDRTATVDPVGRAA